MPTSQRPSLYDEMNIDPFLKYGDLDAGEVGSFQEEAEDILAADRAFHEAMYDGDF